MATTTTYDVLLRYRLDNKASADAEKLRHKLGEAHHAADGLSHVLGHIGMLAGGAMSIHGAWEHLVKFNAEVENAKISLAAMVEGGFGGSFEYAKAQADSLYKEFQKFSQQTPMTTQEMLEFSRGVAVATQQAGGSIQDIVNVTEQGAIAAKALGMESHYAAREIAEMLSGNVNNRMPFAKQLAGLGGKTTEDIRAMSSAERLSFLKQTLNSPAMKDAVSSMSQSFSGVTSTLIDKVQILLGKVGLPLFKAITAEVTRWNEWIDKNSVAIDQFSQSVAKGLVTAFEDVKKVFEFIYDHSDTFIAIGKVWAAIKLGNTIGGMAGGMGLGGMLGNLGTATGKLGFQQVLGPAMFAGIGGYELGKMLGLDKFGAEFGHTLALMTGRTNVLADRFTELMASTKSLEEAQRDAATRLGSEGNASRLQGVIDERSQQISTLTGMQDAVRNMITMRDQGMRIDDSLVDKLGAVGLTLDEIKQFGGPEGMLAHLREREGQSVGRQGLAGVETEGLISLLERSSLTEYQRQTLNEMKAQDEVFGYINQHLAKGIPINIGEVLAILRSNTADPEGAHKAIVEKPKVNVTIHRIEVQSDDPDRYAFRFVQAFRDVTKNPSQAAATLREG